MKPMNWISATGRMPCAARPTLMPAISVSASGVSITRSGPKRSSRPAVARKTPPFTPTSSPSTTTRSSASISCASASVTASTSVISAMAATSRRELAVRSAPGRLPALILAAGGERFALRLERGRQALEKVIEHRLRGTGRGREVVGHGMLDRGDELRAQRLFPHVVPRARRPEVRVEAPQRVARPPALDLVLGAIPARVVGGRVIAHPIGQRLDHVRAAAVARLLERARHRGMDRDHVVAVDLLAFDSARDRLL